MENDGPNAGPWAHIPSSLIKRSDMPKSCYVCPKLKRLRFAALLRGLPDPILRRCQKIKNTTLDIAVARDDDDDNDDDEDDDIDASSTSNRNEDRKPAVFIVPSHAAKRYYTAGCDSIRGHRSRLRNSRASISTGRRGIDIDAWRKSSHEEKICLATTVNNVEFVKRLLDAGVSPNCMGRDGNVPLHFACRSGYTEIVNLLLMYGANVNLYNCDGDTPLHIAIGASNVAIVKLLLTVGADPLLTNDYGRTSIQLAEMRLQLLQYCKIHDMRCIKEAINDIVNVLLTCMKYSQDSDDKIETLTNFCSRLTVSNTTDQVHDEIGELLANMNALSLKI